MMLFKQLFDKETYTYTYFIAELTTKDAVIIDPVITHLENYISLIEEHGLHLKYALETHVHADHITASGLLRQRLGAHTAVSELCGAQNADIQIQDGDVFEFAQSEKIKVIATPGHTPGSISFLWRDKLFTGDALLIDGCGRTDFQGGSANALFDSISLRLFTLPDETLVYPGHDYQGRWVSSIIQERTTNRRLAGKSRAEFLAIMAELDLPKPKLIDQAVPANRYCGLDENQRQDSVITHSVIPPTRIKASPQDWVTAAKQQITEVTIATARQLIEQGNVVVLDVREESEYAAGHIESAILLPRGVLEFKYAGVPALADKSKSVLVYCKTGGRSALAAQTLQNLGYLNVMSMAGGIDAWQSTDS